MTAIFIAAGVTIGAGSVVSFLFKTAGQAIGFVLSVVVGRVL